MPARSTLRQAFKSGVSLLVGALLAGTAIAAPCAFAQNSSTPKPDQSAAPKQDSGQGTTDSGKSGSTNEQMQREKEDSVRQIQQADEYAGAVNVFKRMKQAKVDLDVIKSTGGTPSQIQKADEKYQSLKFAFDVMAAQYLRHQESSVKQAYDRLSDASRAFKGSDDEQLQARREYKEASAALSKAVQPFMPQLEQQIQTGIDEYEKRKAEEKEKQNQADNAPTDVEQPTLPPREVFTPATLQRDLRQARRRPARVSRATRHSRSATTIVRVRWIGCFWITITSTTSPLVSRSSRNSMMVSIRRSKLPTVYWRPEPIRPPCSRHPTPRSSALSFSGFPIPARSPLPITRAIRRRLTLQDPARPSSGPALSTASSATRL